MSDRVAILGAGAQAFALAVHLRRRNHQPVLWSPSGKGAKGVSNSGTILSQGAIEGEFPVDVSQSCAEAIAGASLIVIALPAMGYRKVLDEVAPHLQAGQIVAISAHASFASLYLNQLMADRDISVPIIAWSTTLLRARKTGPAEIRVATLRKQVDMAVLPRAQAEAGLAVCRNILGDHFKLRADILAASLSNVNAQSHMSLCLLNFTRMELGEKWDQKDGSTQAVARLNAALDAERMAIANAFGADVRTLEEHRAQTYGKVKDRPAVVTYGPASTESRYTLEDVPFGLVPLVALAQIVGVEVPLHTCGVKLFSVLYARDFTAENDLLDTLNLKNISRAQIQALCRDGFV